MWREGGLQDPAEMGGEQVSGLMQVLLDSRRACGSACLDVCCVLTA